MNCNEKSNIIISIRAFLLNEVSFAIPYLADRKHSNGFANDNVKESQITIPEDAGFEILFNEESASIKEEEQVKCGGLIFNNTIEFEQPQDFSDNSDYHTQLFNLQRNAHHILITYFGGQKKIVRTDSFGDGYQFSYKQNGLTTSCCIVINNISGTRDIIR